MPSLQRLAVLSGLEFQDGDIEMTVGEIDSVLPQADLLQAESVFIERRGFFNVSGSNGNVFDPGHSFSPPLPCYAERFKAFKPFKKFKSFGARTARSSPPSFFVPDRGDIGCGGDIEERLLHQFQSHVVQLAVSGANAIFQNDDVIS